MNKKLITLAVAAAMAAPLAVSAEPTIYGRMDTAIQYTDADDSSIEAWDVDTGTTRVGLKVSEDLGNGLSAIYQAEWQFSSSEGGSTDGDSFKNRLAYGGLSGSFGTVTIGRQWTPHYAAVDKTDVFNNPDNAGTGPGLVNANKYYIGPTRAGNQVIYKSPNFNGFYGAVSLQMDRDEGGSDSEGIDVWNAALNYENGPISLGLSYLESDEDISDDELWGFGGSYNFGMFKIIGQYEDLDSGDDGNDQDAWALVGEAFFGNNTVRLTYGERDYDESPDVDVYGISLQHNFSSRTRVYVEYIANEYDSDGDTDDVDRDQFNIGLRHDF